jgi:hypothetical protein
MVGKVIETLGFSPGSGAGSQGDPHTDQETRSVEETARGERVRERGLQVRSASSGRYGKGEPDLLFCWLTPLPVSGRGWGLGLLPAGSVTKAAHSFRAPETQPELSQVKAGAISGQSRSYLRSKPELYQVRAGGIAGQSRSYRRSKPELSQVKAGAIAGQSRSYLRSKPQVSQVKAGGISGQSRRYLRSKPQVSQVKAGGISGQSRSYLRSKPEVSRGEAARHLRCRRPRTSHRCGSST